MLERQRIAERWRSQRWDGLRFQFPNWSVNLPDFPFPHTDPDGFATAAEIADFITAYAANLRPKKQAGECERVHTGFSRLVVSFDPGN